MSTEKDFKRHLEELGVEALIDHLRGQGHEIEALRWPDREREGHEGEGLGGVDVEFREDGRPVGLEITELHESEKYARQLMVTERLIDVLKKTIGPRVREVNPNVVIVRWTLHWLPNRRQVDSAVEELIPEVVEIARNLQPGDQQRVTHPPEFVDDMEIVCVEGQTNFGFITSHYEQSMYAEGVAEALAERIVQSGKATQLVSYEDGRILGLDRSFMPLTDLLADELKKRESMMPPNWTHIYFVEPGLPRVVPVWERQPDDAG